MYDLGDAEKMSEVLVAFIEPYQQYGPDIGVLRIPLTVWLG